MPFLPNGGSPVVFDSFRVPSQQDLEVTDGQGAPDDHAIAFGSVNVASGSQSYSVTISNTGETTLNVTGTSLSDDVNYSVTWDDDANEPRSIGAAQSRTATITFDPVSAEALPATFTMCSDDPDEQSVVVSLTGTGSAYRSSLWIIQTGGQYLHFSQNIGEQGWTYNPTGTGTGTNIAAFNGLDGNQGLLEMKLVYKPLGGSNADVEIYLGGSLGTTHSFTNWNNAVDFNVILTGQARATNDNAVAVFDNLNVIPEPGTLALAAAGLAGLARRRRRRA